MATRGANQVVAFSFARFWLTREAYHKAVELEVLADSMGGDVALFREYFDTFAIMCKTLREVLSYSREAEVSHTPVYIRPAMFRARILIRGHSKSHPFLLVDER